VAKIAFCGAIYALGLRPFTTTPIRGVILGTDEYIGQWVGGWEGEEVHAATGLHALQVRASGTAG